MLLQSEYQLNHNDNLNHNSFKTKPQVSIELLPALPTQWKDGSVSGIRARGGITVEMTWRDSRVTSLILTAQKAQKIQLTVNGELKQLRLKKGRNVVISS